MSIWSRTSQGLFGSEQLKQKQGVTTTTTTGTGVAQQKVNPFTGSGQVLTTSDYEKMLRDLLSIYVPPISKEEGEELERLKVEYEADNKLAKLKAFKALSSELRQFVINSHEWESARTSINNTEAEKSERYKELLAKRTTGLGGPYHSGVTVGMDPSSMFYPSIGPVALPNGISLQDLKNAHIEASLEEEVLNE